MRALVVVVVLLWSAVASAATVAGPRGLEARLLAPCCWGSTLDMHDSELATSLRGEIETRWAHGESGEAIQADLVARYGERMIAARSDAPIRSMTGLVTAAVVAVGLGLLVLVRRWMRAPAGAPTPRDALDDRIDLELREID